MFHSLLIAGDSSAEKDLQVIKKSIYVHRGGNTPSSLSANRFYRKGDSASDFARRVRDAALPAINHLVTAYP